jgi:hypothetical protein
MAQASDGRGGSVRPAAALAYSTIGFAALVIFGFGMTSLALNEDVIAVPGLGQSHGVVGVVCAVSAFAASTWIAVRRPHPSYWSSCWTAVAVLVAYLAGLWITALVTGADPVAATSAVAGVATSWFAVVLVAAALVAGWCGVALVRTQASRPRWPWEHDEDE